MIFKITLFLLLNHGVTEFTYSSEGATQIGNGLATDLVIRDIPEGREIRLNPIPNLTVSFKFSKFNNTVFYQERHGNDFDEFYVTLSPFQPKLFNLTVVATFWDGNKNHTVTKDYDVRPRSKSLILSGEKTFKYSKMKYRTDFEVRSKATVHLNPYYGGYHSLEFFQKRADRYGFVDAKHFCNAYSHYREKKCRAQEMLLADSKIRLFKFNTTRLKKVEPSFEITFLRGNEFMGIFNKRENPLNSYSLKFRDERDGSVTFSGESAKEEGRRVIEMTLGEIKRM